MMEPDPVTGENAPGGVFVRIMGGLLIAGAIFCLLGIMGIKLPWVNTVVTAPPGGKQAYVLGTWIVRGWAAYVYLAVCCAAYLFAGVQLARLRRSGWIAAMIVLAYGSLSLFLFIYSGQIEEQGEAIPASQFRDPSALGILLQTDRYRVRQAYRLVNFFCVTQFAFLLYLASEWWRFWKRRGWCASASAQWVKVSACLAFIAIFGVWTFWGADYVREWWILHRARTTAHGVTGGDAARLSLRGRRKLTAILIRRLAAERTREMADAVRQLPFLMDLSLLTAEDIPAIIAASRSADASVQDICWGWLTEIGTTDAQKCLREAAGDSWDTMADSALRCYAGTDPQEAPAFLLQWPTGDSDVDRHHIWLMGLFRDPKVLPVILGAAREGSAEVRSNAVTALQRQPGIQSERALWGVLEDDEIRLRAEAAYALTRIGTAASIPVLIEALKEPDQVYRYPEYQDEGPHRLHDDFNYALSNITGQDFGNDAEAWERWWRKAEPEFDLQKCFAERLLTPLPPPPNEPDMSVEDVIASPFSKATSRQGDAIRNILSRDMRSLAPELARYLELPEEQAPFHFMAAGLLADWGYREGIEWLIEWVDNDLAEGSRMFALRPLGRGCGVNFFSDKSRWRAWWEENRDRFPSVGDD